jgi:hypothetical protein
MNEYTVKLAYSVPEWGDITLKAGGPTEAEDLAIEMFEEQHPEATDIEILGVEEIV